MSTTTTINPEMAPVGAFLALDSLEVPQSVIPGRLKYAELLGRFYVSHYAVHQSAQKLRFFDDYGFGPRSQMLHDLGHNANPLTHNLATHLQVRDTLRLERLVDTYEAFLSLFAGGIHDMGECTHPDIERKIGDVVDDIAWGRKTHHNRNVERAVRRYLYDELWLDTPQSMRDDTESIIDHNANRAAYYYLSIGHWRAEGGTALRAANIVRQAIAANEPLQSERIRQLASLALTVAPRVEVGLTDLANLNYWSAAVTLANYSEVFQANRGQLQDVIGS